MYEIDITAATGAHVRITKSRLTESPNWVVKIEDGVRCGRGFPKHESAMAMKSIKRFCGSGMDLLRHQSIVAKLATDFAPSRGVDAHLAYAVGLFHDIGELVIGDITGPFKSAFIQNGRDLDVELMYVIVEDMMDFDLRNAVLDSGKSESLLRLVRDCDMAATFAEYSDLFFGKANLRCARPDCDAAAEMICRAAELNGAIGSVEVGGWVRPALEIVKRLKGKE